MDERVRNTLDALVKKLIEDEQLPGVLKKRMFLDEEIPAFRWSLSNQLIMLCAGTADARGYRQWQQAGRHVKKGAKAFHILVPIVKKTTQETEQGEEEIEVVSWFRPAPVFKYEDTEGEELEYRQRMEQFDVAQMPLIEVAEVMGLAVTTQISSEYYGAFKLGGDEIVMCTDDEQTFLHELSHAVEEKLGHLSDNEDDEIVAELSGCFLASLYGKRANMAYTREYIRGYSGGRHVGFTILKLIERVAAIHDYIGTHQKAAA